MWLIFNFLIISSSLVNYNGDLIIIKICMRFLERATSRGGKYWGDITTKKGQPTFRKEGDEAPARKTTLWGHLAWGQEAPPISGP